MPEIPLIRAAVVLAHALAAATVAGGCGAPDAFATDRLHRVSIEVDRAHLAQLDDDQNQQRVPCTVTFDGERLEGAGVRKKGGVGSVARLAQKTGFSLRFDEFAPGQTLGGLKRLILNNAKQDPSFVNEHLGYELARRAGLAAARTSHAAVTFNGKPQGLYVVKEAIDKDFLAQHFGAGNDQGNLYENAFKVDFVLDPASCDLKDEVDDMRRRDDLPPLAAMISAAPDAVFADWVGRRLDLEAFIRLSAVEVVTHHWDSYSFNLNNHYLYADPGRGGRFVMIPHGMDQLWMQPDFAVDSPARGVLAQRIRAVPALAEALRAEIARVNREAFDVAALLRRYDRVAAVLRAAAPGAEARLRADLERFEGARAGKAAALLQRRAFLPR